MGWPRRILIAAGIMLVAGGATLSLGRFSYAPMPDRADLLNPDRYPIQTAFDVLGRRVTRAEADRLTSTEAGRKALAPTSGAVAIDPAMVERGRQAFYQETFGNEVFLTDVMGMLDGGLTPTAVALAVAKLGGQGTNNLQVAMAKDVRVGDRVYRTGELVPTGLDVPKGGAFIIGIKTFSDRGHLRMGITCALCHAAVDPGTGKVVEGAPNTDLNAGLLLALAKNSSAYFMHASVPEADARSSADPQHTGSTTTGPALPDAASVEAATKVQVASWPPGSFDLVGRPGDQPDLDPVELLGPRRALQLERARGDRALRGPVLAQQQRPRRQFRHDPARRRRALAVRHGSGDVSRHRAARRGHGGVPLQARRRPEPVGGCCAASTRPRTRRA
ncbi:hypothetical protein ACU4GR_23445 [Methylobacterium oryzae CBMB20]